MIWYLPVKKCHCIKYGRTQSILLYNTKRVIEWNIFGWCGFVRGDGHSSLKHTRTGASIFANYDNWQSFEMPSLENGGCGANEQCVATNA